jgi:multicomponent Na+:H+ antiporter subunit E
VILSGNTNWETFAIGIFVSTLCLWLHNRFLPAFTLEKVRLITLILYPLYLLGQVYLSVFYLIYIIFRGASVEVVDIQTHLKSRFLRIILVNSITLIPGSISLGLNDDMIKVLWVRKKNKRGNISPTQSEAEKALKSKIEKLLLKAEN